MMLRPENQSNAQQIQGVYYPKVTYFFPADHNIKWHNVMFVTSRTTCGGHDYTLVYFLVKTERIALILIKESTRPQNMK